MKQVKNIICCGTNIGQILLEDNSISVKKFYNMQMSALLTRDKVVVNYICPVCKKEYIKEV